jgi:NAD(P)-dependent dehydrogenase (short-subunit alcohol dehydrogenase family)
MNTSLSSKVVLITGAGSGIGKATALLLAQAGAKIALVGQTVSHLEEVARQIRDFGDSALPIETDVSNPAEMSTSVEAVISKWGRLDVVLANAGINGVWAPIDEITPDEWDKTLEVNLRGTFLTVKYAVPHLKKNGGSIIITSSVNGTRIFSNSGATAYSCSKAAQVAFAKMTALELAKFRIRVNVICPGSIETSINDSTTKRNLADLHAPVIMPEGDIPLTNGEPGTAHQVAQLVRFLASDASSHITGADIFIDGAQSLLQG